MKIEAVAFHNFMGFADVEVALEKPIVVILGPNESGKTTLGRDGPRWVLANDARGLKAKDVRLLVRRGSDSMKAAVSVTRGESNLVVTRTPSASTPGTLAAIHNFLGVGTPEAVGYAFDAGSFLALDPEKRKAALFGLAGVAIDRPLFVKAGLIVPGKAGPNEDLCDLATRRGFGPALNEARERRRAADRRMKELALPEPAEVAVDWRGGQTGVLASKVTPADALAWVSDLDRWIARTEGEIARADNSALVETTRASLAGAIRRTGERLHEAERQLKTTRAGLSELEKPERAEALAGPIAAADAALSEKSAALLEAVGRFEAARDDAVRAEAAADAARAAKSEAEELSVADRDRECAHVCPEHPTAAVDLDGATMRETQAAGAASRAKAALEAARAVRDDAQGARDRARMMLERAEKEKRALDDDVSASKVRLEREEKEWIAARTHKAEADAAAERFEAGLADADPAALEEKRSGLEKARAALLVARKTEEAVRTYHAARAAFDAQEAERKRLVLSSEDARRYEVAFDSGGLVGSLVAAPLLRLREVVGGFAERVGLRGKVEIGDDFEIRYDGAPVALAANSVVWRLSLAFAIALGSVSGLRFAVVDEASVCAGRVREEVFDALTALQSEFDQVIVTAAAVAEEKPDKRDRGEVRVIWIEDFRAEVLE